MNLKTGDSLHVCLGGDGGGGRFVAEFAVRKITLHPFLLFDGTDVRANLKVHWDRTRFIYYRWGRGRGI